MRRVVVGFGVSAAVFAGFLYLFDPVAIWGELAGVSLSTFAIGLVAVLLAVGCWAESMRRVLVATGTDLSPVRGFVIYGTGMFAKQVLPMGNAGGPAIMAFVYDRAVDIDFDRSLAVVTVGDFLGLLSSLLLATAGVTFVVLTVPSSRLLQAGLVVVLLAAALLGTVGALLVYRRENLRFGVLGVARLLEDTVGRLSRRIKGAVSPPVVDANLRQYFETFDTAADDRRALGSAAVLAVVGWTLFAVPLYTSTLAVGEAVSFGLVLFVMPVGGLATLVPLPGGIGGVEFAVAGMLVALTAIDPVTVAAIVLLYRVCVYWFLVLLGGACVVFAAVSRRTPPAAVPETSDVGELLKT